MRNNFAMMNRRRITALAALPMFAALPAVAVPVDHLTTVVNNTNATLTTVGFPPNQTTLNVAIASYGYNPVTDEMYIAGFAPNGELRRISNVSGAQTVTRMVSQAQWILFSRDGEPDRTGQPTVGGMLLNPVAVGSAPAYSFALIVDQQTNVNNSLAVDGNTNRRNDLIQRVYTYDLTQVPSGGDGRDVFTSLVTYQEAALAIGQPATATAAHTVSRQFAWSSDGQSAYYIDSTNGTSASTPFGGLWKVDVATGTTQQLIKLPSVNTEPAVISLGGGVDQVLFRGSAATGNTGGIDFVTHDGATTSAVQVFLPVQELRDFLEKTGSEIDSITKDDPGNLYFYDGTNRVLVRRDTAGRMSKVLQYDERDSFFTGVVGTAPNPNANMLRLQTREVAHGNGFDVTQVMYLENSPLNFVAGVYAFKPGDFNRDNAVNAADFLMFTSSLALRGAAGTIEDARFDMNGNKVVDWKDVKILQQFAGFSDGDANFDGLVDYLDLSIVGLNYLTDGHTWDEGDFRSAFDALYAATVADVNRVDYADLELLSLNWDLAKPTFADLDRQGYTGQFRDDVIRAFDITAVAPAVPEPSTVLLGALGGLMLVRRRRV